MTSRFLSFLGPYLVDYLELRQKLGYTSFTRDDRARDLDVFAWSHGLSSWPQLTEELLLRWMHARPARSKATKNALLRFARGFFDYLLRQGLVPYNPAKRLPYLKAELYKPYLYTLQDIIKILEAAKTSYEHDKNGFRGFTLHTLLFLLYACGLRISEALNLQIKDVDFGENTLALWKTKFHKERLVPFSDATASKLRDYLTVRLKRFPTQDTGAAVFCHGGDSFRSNGPIEFRFRKILQRCGITAPQGVGTPRIHDLRRAFAVHRLYKWYQEGFDILNKLPLLSTYMGHVHIEHTQIYLTVTQALLREADRRFQQGFGGIARKAARRALPTASHRPGS